MADPFRANRQFERMFPRIDINRDRRTKSEEPLSTEDYKLIGIFTYTFKKDGTIKTKYRQV